MDRHPTDLAGDEPAERGGARRESAVDLAVEDGVDGGGDEYVPPNPLHYVFDDWMALPCDPRWSAILLD